MRELNKRIYWLIFCAFVCVVSNGCLKRDEYPDEPSVTFKRLDIGQDNSAHLYLDFVDGDGNFGLQETDWDMSSDSCTLRYNLFIIKYELRNGEWVDVSTPCDLYHRVPWAKPTGQIQTQKGEIKVNLYDNWYLVPQTVYDTIRFEIYLTDRTRNKSNVITTGIYLKP